MKPATFLAQTTEVHALREAYRWAETRAWLFSASAFSLLAAGCYQIDGLFYHWYGYDERSWIFFALVTLPFVIEGFIQFRTWPARLFWIVSGISIWFFVARYAVWILGDYWARYGGQGSPFPSEWPAWISGPVMCLLPATLEFIAARKERDRPWIWLVVTTFVLGLSYLWIPPLGKIVQYTLNSISAKFTVTGIPLHACICGAIWAAFFFTRVLTGSMIATRRPVERS